MSKEVANSVLQIQKSSGVAIAKWYIEVVE
jgi:hypothetical protein